MQAWLQPLLGSISQPGSNGPGPSAGDPLLYAVPAGVPDALAWFSPRAVEVDGSSNITKMLNRGSTGAVNDATPNTGNLAALSQPAAWGGKDVFDIPNTSTGGYGFGNIAEVRTVVTVATYQDGVQATFTNYDGLFSGGTGASIQLVGRNGANHWEDTIFTAFVDGVNQGTGQAVVLPADKKGLAVTNTSVFSAAGRLFRDDFATSRNWWGLCGDVIMFQDVLTDPQIADVHAMLASFYSS